MIKRFRFRKFKDRADALELDLVVCVDGRTVRRRVKVPTQHTTPAAINAVSRGRAPADHTPAVRWGREYVRALVQPAQREPASAKRIPTFKEFAQRFVTERAASIRAKPATRRGYEVKLKNYLLPELGDLRLDQIGVSEITRLQTRPEFKVTTINGILATLRTILAWAVELEILDRLPRIKPLKASVTKRPEDLWWQPQELERLVEAARDDDLESLLVVLLGADAGLRVGEMVTLRYVDVDFSKGSNGVLWVRRNLSAGEIVDTPKGSRLRCVPLSSRLATALRRHKHLAHECVLYRRVGGHPVHWTPHVVRWRLDRVCAAADLPSAGPHKLRHTCGSRLGARGYPQHEIQRYLGHAKAETTAIYLHSVRETQFAMADSLG